MAAAWQHTCMHAIHRTLQWLHLGGNFLKTVQPLVEPLDKGCGVRALDLSNNAVVGSCASAKVLGELLQRLDVLDVSANVMSLEALAALRAAQAEGRAGRLVLDYMHPVDADPVRVVVRAAMQQRAFVEDAFFSFPQLRGWPGRGAEELRLRGAALGRPGLCELVTAWLVAQHPALTALDAANTGLGPGSLETLGRYLRGHRRLATLYLEENALGVGGARALQAAVRDMPALAFLRFNFCTATPTMDNVLCCPSRAAVVAFAALDPAFLAPGCLGAARHRLCGAAEAPLAPLAPPPGASAWSSCGSACRPETDFWGELLTGAEETASSVSNISTEPSLEASAMWRMGQMLVSRDPGDEARLGRGAYGAVFRGTDRTKGTTVAIKVIGVRDAPRGSVAAIEREVLMLSSLHHPNIVTYFGCCVEAGAVNIVMEFVPATLHAVIRKVHAEAPMCEAVIQSYAWQILRGVAYLHGEKVVHRDLKPGNILVDTAGTCKVADFGCSKHLSDSAAQSGFVGTPLYTAPEVIRGEAAGPEADVWGVGCIVREMFTGRAPFDHLMSASGGAASLQLKAMFQVAVNARSPLLPDDGVSPAARALLQACFDPDPARRPSCARLLREEWVGGGAPAPAGSDAGAAGRAGAADARPEPEEGPGRIRCIVV